MRTVSITVSMVLFTLMFVAAVPGQEAAPASQPVLGEAAEGTPDPSAPPPPQTEDPGWPRSFEEKGSAITLHQPQLESWDAYAVLGFRAAVAIRGEQDEEPVYGLLEGTAQTHVNHEDSTVLIQHPQYTTSFPDVDAERAEALDGLMRTVLPGTRSVVIDLDRLVANVARSEVMAREVEVNLEPPPIFVSREEAVLVVFIGEPVFAPIEGTTLQFATNTNWDLLLETTTSRYYLLVGDGWLSATDVQGPWSSTGSLPSGFSQLPDDENWNEVRRHVPGQSIRPVPQVFVSTEPAELIVLDGAPALVQIPGTELMFAMNTDSDLVLNLGDRRYYLLVAGRWFRAKGIDGPWTAATEDLPEDFARIPQDHPRARVLASVPGTPEAAEAVIQASIPRKASVQRDGVTTEVQYDGEPVFAPIEGSAGVLAAGNTSQAVFAVGDRYYCCDDGIWFEADDATGPWVVCASVPDEIYTIPTDSPYYNVTYVQVYDATPETVTVGYTAGYTGSYVVGGVLMFGAGLALGAALADGDYYWGYRPPSFYSYGCHAQYSYYGGGWARGARYYGPYGGAGYGARYNARTGTYARGAYAYGPRGAAGTAHAYNPWTGRGGATAQARTPYGSRGRSVVYHGNDWARFGHRSGPYGTTVAYRTSDGDRGVAHVGGRPHGDVYAGRDGRVYRLDQNRNWQRHDNRSRAWQGTTWAGRDRAPDRARAESRGGASGDRRGVVPRTPDRASPARGSGPPRSPERASPAPGRHLSTPSGLDTHSRSRQRGNYHSSRRRSHRAGGASRSRSRP